MHQPRPFAAVLWGGLLAGTLDLAQAFVGFGLLGATPYRILQHIAGGIFGSRSYDMGWVTAAIGIVLHFTIAFTAAVVYFLLSRKFHVLIENPVPWGLLYGEAVFVFMYFVVLPLSAWGPARFNIATYITGPIGHPLLVGLPISLCMRRFTKSYAAGGVQPNALDSTQSPMRRTESHSNETEDLSQLRW